MSNCILLAHESHAIFFKPSFRVLLMQYIQRCGIGGSGDKTILNFSRSPYKAYRLAHWDPNERSVLTISLDSTYPACDFPSVCNQYLLKGLKTGHRHDIIYRDFTFQLNRPFVIH